MLVFSVERSLKGSIGRTVEVRTAADSAGCGLEAPVGTRVGLVLERRGGAWHGYLCWQFDPAELLAAALPLPPPNGRGPVALIVGGGFGESRLAALDARGRTLAYGRGTGRVGLLAVCPGGRRLAEVAFVGSGQRLVIRATRTLRIVRRQALSLPRGKYAQRLACEDQAGASVLVFSTSGLYRVNDARLRTLWSGACLRRRAHGAARVPKRGRERPSTPQRRRTHRPSATGGLTPGTNRCDGAQQLGNGTGRTARPVRSPVRDRSGRPREALATGHYGKTPERSRERTALLASNRRLLFVPAYGTGTSRVLDASLRTRSRFRWTATSAAVIGSRAFGIDLTRSLSARGASVGPRPRRATASR